LLFLSLVCFSFSGSTQTFTYNFRHLTSADGLSDGIVRTVTQDSYGFIWIGTSYGLDRFDGITIRTFLSKPGDTNSLPDNYIQTAVCDDKGDLWIATMKNLCRYDYSANRFIRYAAAKDVVITDIRTDKKGTTWLATNDGLWCVDKEKTSIHKFLLAHDSVFQKRSQCRIRQIMASPGGDWYLATNIGIQIFNPYTNRYGEIRHDSLKKFSISGDAVVSLALDPKGYLWAACVSPKPVLNRIDLQNQAVKFYDHFTSADKKSGNNLIHNLLLDRSGRLWATSSTLGLSLYDETNDDFYDYLNDPFVPNSILSDQNITLYQGANGIIWIGTIGHGLSYFNPDKSFFYSIQSRPGNSNSLPDHWCRAVCEDDQNNLWLGTGGGLAKLDRATQRFTIFTYEEGRSPAVYSNSIRSLLKDDLGDIWIGTAKGLNRYHPASGKMDFFGDKEGIPLSFFWMLAKDKNGEVWIGSRDGLYHYLRKEKRFEDLSNDPLLSKYAHKNIQALFIDSRNRLWAGILDTGILLYDLVNKKVALLTTRDSLVSDTRTSAFAEDKNGIIWIGSEEGLTAYDPLKNKARFFNRDHGLPSNRTNNLMVDKLNRLWIGTSNGLCVLNEGRDSVKRFDVNDGLLTNQFNEQSAFCTSDGLFIIPSYKGFLVFSPEKYRRSRDNIPVYVTSFTVLNKEWNTGSNTEAIRDIHLGYDQNFFTIELAGLNYMNPRECIYVHKLEPFDKGWIYSRRREFNYTNVPAGDYVFRYKVLGDDPSRDVPEKTIAISIAAVFYKTWWFQLLAIVSAIVIIYEIYIFQIRHKQRILLLQHKAESLEKEKTIVMYESLKQQLNPHFLFNSLTSLSSLIQTDQKAATQFLEQMSKIYRYILKNKDTELVTLEEDLKLANWYIQLQKARFQNGLQVCIRVDSQHLHRRIVPVTLQNLIENAIKHNIIDGDTPLEIDIHVENDYLLVRNNLQKKNFVETSNKQGLANMQSLYRYLSGRHMNISQNEHFFTVKIPLI